MKTIQVHTSTSGSKFVTVATTVPTGGKMLPCLVIFKELSMDAFSSKIVSLSLVAEYIHGSQMCGWT